MLHDFTDSPIEKGPEFTDGALRAARVLGFHFKCEDFRDDGGEVGPLYAILQGSELRSARYVTLVEANKLARIYGVSLTES